MRAGICPVGSAWANALRRVVRPKAYSTHSAHLSAIPPDSGSILVGNELGWRLAGITDGEGCFYIAPHPRVESFSCAFTIGLRADDRALLELLRDSTGLGRIHDVAPSKEALRTRPGTQPQSRWTVARKAECAALVVLFDEYPPISKKAREYALWRQAVRAWQESRWDLMREYHIALKATRAFRGEPVEFVVDDPQMSLEEAGRVR